MTRVDVYCPACRHRGKVRTTDAAADPKIADVVVWGPCTRCGEQRTPGTPPKGGAVGRPRKPTMYLVTDGSVLVGLYTRREDADAARERRGGGANLWTATLVP